MEQLLCRVCGSKDLSVGIAELAGFEKNVVWHLGVCTLCKSSSAIFHSDDERDSAIYDDIYKIPRLISGYERYERYARKIRRQKDPAAWLGAREPTYRWIFENLAKLQRNGLLSNESTIVEIGSGLGYTTFAVQKSFGLQCIGVDRSSKAVARASKRFGSHFQQEMPANFEVIISTEVIEHTESAVGFLRQLREIMQPGNFVILTTPLKLVDCEAHCWFTDLPPVHTMWATELGIREAATAAGLHVLSCTTDRGLVDSRHHGECRVAFRPRLNSSKPTPANLNELARTFARNGKAKVSTWAPKRATESREYWGSTLGFVLEL